MDHDADPPAPNFPLDGTLFGPEQPCFGCSPTHPTGLRLAFAREGDAAIVTRFVPGPGHQGPPGIMHGGLVLTLADELAAWTIIGLRERFGFTAKVDARIARPVRIGAEVRGRGVITRDGSRVVEVAVTLAQGEVEAFRGTFTFVLLDERAAAQMLGAEALPEAWRRFARAGG